MGVSVRPWKPVERSIMAKLDNELKKQKEENKTRPPKKQKKETE